MEIFRLGLTVYLEGIPMDVFGGFKHESKGFYVEISPKTATKVDRRSVSVWKLKHTDEIQEKIFFREIFGLSPQAARSIDHRKGVPGLGAKIVYLQELPTAEASYEMAIDNIAVSS